MSWWRCRSRRSCCPFVPVGWSPIMPPASDMGCGQLRDHGFERGAEGPLQLGEKLGAGDEAVFGVGHVFEDIGCLNHIEPVEGFGEALLVCHVGPPCFLSDYVI